MTVQEFIDKLSQYDPNTAVTLELRDLDDDYLYFIDMGEIEVVEQDEAIIGGSGAGYIDDDGDWQDDDLIKGKAITFIVNDCEKAFYGV